MSAVDAAQFDLSAVLRAGDHVAWPQGVGEPTGLTRALMTQAERLPSPVTLVLGMVTTKTLDHPNAVNFRYLCLNGAAATRVAVARSGGRVIPAHVSALPGLFASRRIPVDVVLIRARPTADPGVLSLGVLVDFVHEMIDAARLVVAEIDERLPLTHGDALLARERVQAIVTADGDEPTLPDVHPSAVESAVARRVAELIPNRATVQVGVGALPVGLCRCLAGHADLGLHSGVLPDGVVDLIASGVVTNRYKGIDVGQTVTGGLFGTRRLFDFAHQNPALVMRRATHTHAATTLARLNALHTVNSAVALDLSGQVNAETALGRYVGAVGGQVDFVRGARLSTGGRSIIALTSTTPDEKHSKIVATLAGQPVTTARSDVDLVVTEHGVADLWGLDLPARARALIAIAHPAFRDELSAQAAAAFPSK